MDVDVENHVQASKEIQVTQTCATESRENMIQVKSRLHRTMARRPSGDLNNQTEIQKSDKQLRYWWSCGSSDIGQNIGQENDTEWWTIPRRRLTISLAVSGVFSFVLSDLAIEFRRASSIVPVFAAQRCRWNGPCFRTDGQRECTSVSGGGWKGEHSNKGPTQTRIREKKDKRSPSRSWSFLSLAEPIEHLQTMSDKRLMMQIKDSRISNSTSTGNRETNDQKKIHQTQLVLRKRTEALGTDG